MMRSQKLKQIEKKLIELYMLAWEFYCRVLASNIEARNIHVFQHCWISTCDWFHLVGFLTPWYSSIMEATRFVNIANFDLLECFIQYFSCIWVSCMKFISFKLQQINNFFGILGFESLRFDLFLAKFPFQQGTYSIYFTFAMPCGNIIPKDLTTWWKLCINCQVMVPL